MTEKQDQNKIPQCVPEFVEKLKISSKVIVV